MNTKPYLFRCNQALALGSIMMVSLLTIGCHAAEKPSPVTVKPSQAALKSWTGPSLREFSGVNQSGEPESPLFTGALSWNRLDLHWGLVEPEKGVWKQDVLDGWGRQVLALKQRNAHLLPVLDYTAQWAADRSEREYDLGNTHWKVSPRADGQFDIEVSEKQADGSYKVVETKIEDAKDLSKFPPANIADWENYVRRVVTYLRRAPYNVEYFQIWNEAYPNSGFWVGGMDDYMNRVHFPAARIIRELGGKVVYGGWPDKASIEALPDFLDHHQAWESIDVADFHYFVTPAMEYFRQAADKRGYKDLAIWQTEIAFTTDPLFVANNYPRMLHWSLGNKWDRADKYKVFFFPHRSPADLNVWAGGTGLVAGDGPTPHGQSLQTLATLLKGSRLSQYKGILSTPALSARPGPADSSLEAFAVDNRIVLAVHLDQQAYQANESVTFSLPLRAGLVAGIERVDLTGQRSRISQIVTSNKTRTTFKVPVKDAAGSTARGWNDKSPTITFFIAVSKK